MAYADDSVKGKLSALNETQDSIVATAQWLIFHRRHADRTVQLWLSRLRDSGANKRLNLIYLANEIVQQCKARRRDEFPTAFSPIIADATATAYKAATNEVQTKLKRVVEVWRQRQIFELPIQEAVEKRILELDRARQSGRKGLFAGSIFSDDAAIPIELRPLVSVQVASTRAAGNILTVLPTANADYQKLTDPDVQAPSPPVHAARLSALLKLLASAEGAVAESIKARKALIEGLEKVLSTNKNALAREESQILELANRKSVTEAKKRDVEDAIMRGLSAESSPHENSAVGTTVSNTDASVSAPVALPFNRNSASPAPEPERPNVEALTPPQTESLSPINSPSLQSSLIGAEKVQKRASEALAAMESVPQPPQPLPAGSDLLSSLSMPIAARARVGSSTVGYANKKRKFDGDELYAGITGGDAMEGIEAEVAELLRQESSAR